MFAQFCKYTKYPSTVYFKELNCMVCIVVLSLSHVQLFVTPWTVVLSMAFSRQDSWSGLPLPSPGDLPDPGIEHTSPALAGKLFTTKPPRKYVLVGPKVCLGFSIKCYRKTRTTFLANPINHILINLLSVKKIEKAQKTSIIVNMLTEQSHQP